MRRYCTLADGADFLAKMEAEPEMFVKRTHFRLPTICTIGRIVDVFWATMNQQDKMARFGGCVQMDTTPDGMIALLLYYDTFCSVPTNFVAVVSNCPLSVELRLSSPTTCLQHA